MGYAGANWIERQPDCGGLSELGREAADLLGDVFLGIYHLNHRSLSRVEWGDSRCIRVTIGRELATFDGDELTRLVVLGHHRMLRVAVDGRAPGFLRVTITKRTGRTGSMFERMPTLEDHAKELEKHYRREGAW